VTSALHHCPGAERRGEESARYPRVGEPGDTGTAVFLWNYPWKWQPQGWDSLEKRRLWWWLSALPKNSGLQVHSQSLYHLFWVEELKNTSVSQVRNLKLRGILCPIQDHSKCKVPGLLFPAAPQCRIISAEWMTAHTGGHWPWTHTWLTPKRSGSKSLVNLPLKIHAHQGLARCLILVALWMRPSALGWTGRSLWSRPAGGAHTLCSSDFSPPPQALHSPPFLVECCVRQKDPTWRQALNCVVVPAGSPLGCEGPQGTEQVHSHARHCARYLMPVSHSTLKVPILWILRTKIHTKL
jgi:hypothetical protein